MSAHLCADSGMTGKVYCDLDNKDSIVDIYVSAESLRVYDNPWVEGSTPTAPASQHPGIDTGVDNKRGKYLCLLFSVFFGQFLTVSSEKGV